MKENNRSIVIDGVTEVDDLALVSHFAQTESRRIQELNTFKRGHPGSGPSTEENVSHLYNEGDDSDGTDSEVEALEDPESPQMTQSSNQSYSDQTDPLDNLRIIDTTDLPERVSEELPISKIGKCKSAFEDILIIESLKDSKVLDLGSIVCKEDRTILGTVNDTFGQTTSPYYMVIMRNKKLKVEVEEYVFCDLKHSTYVTDENVYYTTKNNAEDSEDEKMDEINEKTQNKLKQSYKDL